VLSSSVPTPDQQRCKHCGEIIPAGDRRPREYCSDAHRKAATRKRRAAPEVLPQRPAENNSPTAESAKNGGENPNKINDRISGQNGPSLPLNLFGSGYRWPGANVRSTAKTSAAVDAELGVGGPTIVSPDGVTAAIVPSRQPRSRSTVRS
jgi:hypothetical protein